MTIKGREFWMATHRYSGLVILVFLGFAALTGSVLVYLRPLDAAINADLFRQSPVREAPPVPRLVEAFRASHPEFTVRSFPLSVPVDARIPVKVTARDGVQDIDQVFLDRASGELAGTRSSKAALSRRGIAGLLHSVHYTLMLGDYGRWFMGVIALTWLVSNFVGIYLTFPARGAFWKQWKRTWRFSFKSAFPRLMMDLHRSSGLWLLVPLTLLAVTSVCMNFFGEAYGPVVDRLVPERELALPKSEAKGPLTFFTAVEQARAVAQEMDETWHPATVLYDAAEDRIGVTMTDNGLLSYHDLGPIYFYFDAQSGRLAEVFDPYHGNGNLAMYRWLYPVHSGHIAGLPTEILVIIMGLVIFGMCVTGVYLWWKKRPARVMRRRTLKGSAR
ncbi:PepSY-associated TM helix domain-containing protein [Novosphingobium album (ex Hu et al. 2023)]|uniref:PepSY domain-containing protein n=1 Tax=Novosphingobium album (ex Hu et al. 2023) TaxID=2930093 RepID=A0ABT0B0D4_9SPHN|nr:PepSY-associated TM helix domain-containing protein [Novosphingobium album (ex Hu et al. 2023)]MCJ2178396.1 PepSY domain-containing protein [Novosphingobium album (ex Hu et al. 2023)]